MTREQRYRSKCQQVTKKLYPIGDSTTCSQCGGNHWLSHHHIDRNPRNNSPDNILILCHRCHLRLHRQARDVGNRTRLTKEQIVQIRNPGTNLRKLASILGYNESYLRKVRRGKKNPLPIDSQRKAYDIPSDWVFEDNRGKPRALTGKQVKEILSFQPTLGTKRAKQLAKRYHVGLATIWKARGRYGCYGSKEYDLA